MSYQDSRNLAELREGIRRMRAANSRAKQELIELNAILSSEEGVGRGSLLTRQELEEYHSRLTSAGFRVAWNLQGSPLILNPSLAASARRIFQELTTNLLKYAVATELIYVEISIDRDIFALDIRNTHQASKARVADLSNGWGLAGIEERVQLHGGAFRVDSDSERWRTNIVIPIDHPSKSGAPG